MLIVSSQLVYKGTADTQIYLISPENPDFLILFTGFLGTTDEDINQFQCLEIIYYTGSQVDKIIKMAMSRGQEKITTPFLSYRRIGDTDEIAAKMVDWLFTIEDIEIME